MKNNKKSLKFTIKNFFKPEGIQVDMLRYRPNKISFNCAILAIACIAVGFCLFYSNCSIRTDTGFNLFGTTNPGPWVAVDVLLNIVMLIFLFLASVRMQVFSRIFGILSIVFGAFEIIRPFTLYLAMSQASCLDALIYTIIMILDIVAGGLLIIGGIVSIMRGAILKDYLSKQQAIENERLIK